jgi:hypothetical protein
MRTLAQTVLLAILWSAIPSDGNAQVASPTGTIAGTLTGQDGKPLAGVRVAAMVVPDTVSTSDDTLVFVNLARTDDQGRYRLEDVPPGRYFITAGFVNVPTYYPGVTARSDATVVVIRAGANLPGIDFSAASPSSIGGAVSGRVPLSDFPGAQQLVLSGRLENAGTAIAPLQTPIRGDGTFAFPKVPPGTYSLRILGPNNLVYGSASRTTVEVVDRDVEVQVKSDVSFVVGRIVTADGSPLPALQRENNSQIMVTSLRPNGSESTTIQSGGMFVLRRIQGEMSIGVNNLPLGYTVKSIAYGGRELVSGALRIDGPSVGEVLITVDAKQSGDVQGVRVSGSAINVPAELFVQKKPRLWLTFRGGPLLETPLERDGSFEFAKVPPGVYTFFFMSMAERLLNAQIVVGATDIRDVSVDLRNNPFPEYPAGSYGAVFDSRQVTLHGVITQGLTQIRSPLPIYYFRMDLDAEGTGRIERWGIMLTPSRFSDQDIAKLRPGARIRIVVNPDRDGSPRGGLVSQEGSIVVESP